MRIVVAITGATGAIYGIRLLEALKDLGVESHLVLSEWANRTIELETTYKAQDVRQLAARCYEEWDQGAAISSGSFKHDGLAIVPCSMKSLAAIANGFAGNLVHRAADVTLKEQRKLIMGVRETPLNVIHLENMLKLARLGAVIIPPIPAYYNHPQTIADLTNHFVGRVLDHLGLEHNLCSRWGETAPAE